MAITPEEEILLIQEWLDETSFDDPASGVPRLDSEEDDED